ncbi:bifunctional N(6)-L-threonylcarbamoyladenine synthase/serine/threonine protein kinase [Methanonatronarchaeum sp. AMET6-2]|uniref:bifunctional N(6)-L-threonylcarbamoyladenine synthase/serine/threonine protein kinase n=1 Tax=Methanonatronarchaeum sp. AMET6-2 TaxID=2933293 RepID=UPI00120D2578|nr:bifunctional N(6)-L-threonylcarbamoyladenine synthase/serine/threonine protein kinase [Methanonatronarchaeum sp. AMET6-2]RZN60828.1 MAG: bifunctional N(6)-L-threonylcarbamoyladenine synthase/serine/threonine protein kinase [Methanonatronarchaeia archaeon]UOY09523.1 bifunctional N(6)-L-threonylcarbamoyladenine synthase/serine/threonine protein kinase [Methanonatronarchaeum sp. AMET6-2]
MKALGIEGTAWNLSIGIVDDKGVLSHISNPYEPVSGGIHPREASQHHADNIAGLIKEALELAEIKPGEIDLISFSQGPGMGQCLRVAATAARALSISHRIPLVGVNHCIAHIEVGRWETGSEDPVVLYVSGANSQVLGYRAGRYRVFGETLDIGIGNALDKFARKNDISHPGGPEIEKLALEGNKLIELPYTVKGMDFSFSGLITSAENKIGIESLENISYSIQETAFAMLTEVTERALAHLDKDEVLLCGGVAHNERLTEMLEKMAESRDTELYKPSPEFLGDNGAMIAHTGMKMYKSGIEHSPDIKIKPDFRPDQVEVAWR